MEHNERVDVKKGGNGAGALRGKRVALVGSALWNKIDGPE